MYQFRDPIHGFIELSDLELKIVDAPAFQRLRNIKQLATTYLVYHGAEHTRFGHSLGVMHLVTRAFASALENYKKANKKDLFDPVKTAWYAQILRLIALVHDLGHAPFSHASEVLFDDGTEHEDFTRKIICESEIAQYIGEIGVAFRKKHGLGSEYDISPELLWLIYGERNPELDARYVLPDYKFLKSFMDGELDCDKMDYLLRDSYYCGVNYGKYDLSRLTASLSVYRDERDRVMRLAVERGGLHAFEEFVIARYFMFIQVYFHKTRRYLDKLLAENISEILPGSKYPAEIAEYLQWDDGKILAKIEENAARFPPAERFVNRRVKSCAYETIVHSGRSDDALFDIVRRALQDALGYAPECDAANKLAHKIPVLEPYDMDSGRGVPVFTGHFGKPSDISTESVLLQSMIKPINIKRIYVEKADADRARQIVKNLLDGKE
ncbi:MAG: HD domain-containing protein [Clostridiales Family XIII bacterium]|nr:HD domain-containing protein [Clostridiales Family XIII bacterium]